MSNVRRATSLPFIQAWLWMIVVSVATSHKAFERLLSVDPTELKRSLAEKGEPPEQPLGVDDTGDEPAT